MFPNIMNVIISRILECGRQVRQMDWKKEETIAKFWSGILKRMDHL